MRTTSGPGQKPGVRSFGEGSSRFVGAVAGVLCLLLWTTGASAQAPTFTVLHSFGATPTGGTIPLGTVTQRSNGAFYGATVTGGLFNQGTIFRMDASGVVTTVHSFSGPDGARPSESDAGAVNLVQASDGTIYGTTRLGGASNYGTVFKLDTNDQLTVLHEFNGFDGREPSALILAADGHLYGTTEFGGAGGPGFSGAAFRINPATGQFTLLHTFGTTEAAYFVSGLIQGSDLSFYGVTCQSGAGVAGTVFRMTSSGAVTVLHNFPASGPRCPGARQICEMSSPGTRACHR